MTYDAKMHHRKSIRLKNYDYSQAGLYFLTICTHERKTLFGTIHNGQVVLNGLGYIACDEWLKSAQIREN